MLSPGTNKYINNYDSTPEQKLLDDLVIESIKISGQDVYYLPRTRVYDDSILLENTVALFESHHPMEMLFENTGTGGNLGFGATDTLTKFGVVLPFQQNFVVSKRRFQETMQRNNWVIWRPTEGDLIYSPLLRTLFEIKFVDPNKTFRPLGVEGLVYHLSVEAFQYSQETLNTKIDVVDDIGTKLHNDDDVSGDKFGKNDVIQTNGDSVVDQTETNPFGNF